MYPRKEFNAFRPSRTYRQAPPSVFKPFKEFLGDDPKFTDIDIESQNTNLTEVVKKNFRDYCDSSTIHGFKYIGGRTRCEKFLWTMICFFLFFGCGTQIYEIVGKWKQNPLIFLLDTKASPINEIEFPAVTICPQRMPNQNRFNYTDFLLRWLYDKDIAWNDEQMILFDAVSKICPHRLLKYGKKLERYIHEVPFLNNTILIELMDEYFLPDSLKLAFCKGVIPNVTSWACNLMFTRVWLKEGLCYSFNLLPKDQIFRPGVKYPLAEQPNFVLPKDGIGRHNAKQWPHFVEEQTSSYRVSSRRERLYVRTRAYDDFTDETCNPDFFIFIHNPNELPWDLQSNGYLIQIDEFVKNVLIVTPSVVRTEQSLKKAFTPEQRNCYFEDERPLKFFQKYSQSNCELECMTNASFHPKHFNCTAFWMPRTSDMPLCHMAKYIMWATIEAIATEDLKHCDCLPDCNSVNYAVKIYSSHTPYFDDAAFTKEDAMNYPNDGMVLLWQKRMTEKIFLFKNKDFNFEIPLDDAIKQSNYTPDFDIWKWNYSEIEVHFKDSDFLALRRHLAYSFADFVSQVGGIFGCFLGISIFSMIEIAYFCTVKMIKEMKQGAKKPESENEFKGRIQFMKVNPKMVLHSEIF